MEDFVQTARVNDRMNAGLLPGVRVNAGGNLRLIQLTQERYPPSSSGTRCSRKRRGSDRNLPSNEASARRQDRLSGGTRLRNWHQTDAIEQNWRSPWLST